MLKQMHRLQPAIDVTLDEEDVRLIQAKVAAPLEAARYAFGYLTQIDYDCPSAYPEAHIAAIRLMNTIREASDD